MKYILMMNTMKANRSPFPGWSREDIQRHIGYMIALQKELKDSGESLGGEGLAFPNEAKLVTAGSNGEPITDGVFPESKEFLAGYWIVQVETPERAYQLAAKASAAPGKDGVPLNMPIEVRQVMAGPPPDLM